jgi:hypothetical protein
MSNSLYPVSPSVFVVQVLKALKLEYFITLKDIQNHIVYHLFDITAQKYDKLTIIFPFLFTDEKIKSIMSKIENKPRYDLKQNYEKMIQICWYNGKML